tara:strand:- start:687 stop:1574 length:888 start_codon:yes stop_codon:yes gene_type:complete
MNNYLIFRTDRIGDFLLTLILINSIKRNDPSSHITLVSSKKNHDYIKSFNIVDKVILLKSGIKSRIKIIFLLRKQNYKSIIIHDLKKRSKIISFFLNSRHKYSNKINNISSYINEIKKILKSLNYDFNNNDLNTFYDRQKNKLSSLKNNYLLLHFDEKWFINKYINTYVDIEPSENDLNIFINKIISKTKYDLVITTGINTPEILNNYFSKNKNDKIKLFKNQTFIELEKLVLNSSVLISCHGSISHLATAQNIKQIDIIDKSYNYKRWTDHFRNYKFVYRQKFPDMIDEIFKII